MDKSQKLELGIEIISGIKASAYGVSIEEGRTMALNETEAINFQSYKNGTTPECRSWELVAKRNKNKLESQALFVADIALNKIIEISLKNLQLSAHNPKY